MRRIGIIGGGNMGEALVKGLLEKRRVDRRCLWVGEMDPVRGATLRRHYRIEVTADNRLGVRQSDLLILAVKPQELSALLEEISPLPRGRRVISIAAGVPTRWIEDRAGKVPVVRAMPNLAARVGSSISALSRGRYATSSHLEEARAIFEAVGEVVVLPERTLDAVTVLSGSGPAYVAYLAKLLIRSGEEVGLPHRLSRRLVLQTFLGASRFLIEEGIEPDAFIRKVASKGGTTEAAFSVLNRGRLPALFQRALREALRRAKQLSRR